MIYQVIYSYWHHDKQNKCNEVSPQIHTVSYTEIEISFRASNDDNFLKIKTFLFQCMKMLFICNSPTMFQVFENFKSINLPITT